MMITGRTLLAFVDTKDPFMPSEVVGEELAGPILSLMGAREFNFLFLLYTPYTRAKALATRDEVTRRYASCLVMMHELPVSDPNDYSSLMGRLARQVREIMRLSHDADSSVCVSSGTPEMRAAWFLLAAVGALPAKLLQVDSPADMFFGAPDVKEVRLDSSDWASLKAFESPPKYQAGIEEARRLLEDTESRTTGNTKAISELTDRLGVLIEETSRLLGQTGGRPPTKRSRLRASIEEARRLMEETRARSIENAHSISEMVVRLQAFTGRRWAIQFARALPSRIRPTEAFTDEDVAMQLPRVSASLVRRIEAPPPMPGLDEALQELGIFVGSPVMRQAAERAAIVAQSDQPLSVLLLGETGTGKELFAKLIHRLSNRRNGPMQMVNCAAIPEPLAEDFLFGHVKGAFTGANDDRQGVFECAHRGTLFLDELATLSLALQAKLLRVLNDGQVIRTGTLTPRPVDVRIVAATKPNLSEEIAAGRFLADLYWRLEVAVITLPPLRERREEIESLACWLLRRINQQRQRPRQLTKDALLRLEQHNWPGNVRELSNVLVRSVLFSLSEILGPEDLLITPKPAQDDFVGLPTPRRGFKVDDYLKKARTHLYKRALAMSKTRSAAAELLGVTKQAVNKFATGQEDNED